MSIFDEKMLEDCVTNHCQK